MNHKNAFKRVAIALTCLFSAPALATNGYFTHGTGSKNKSMAGAGLAAAEDATSLANNPAAALVATGQLEIGVALFSPTRTYTSSASLANGNGGAFTIGPNDLNSDSEYFGIPHVAYSWGLDDNSALGLAFYGRGGMNTKWADGTATFDPDGPGPAPVMTLDGTFGAGTAGVDLIQAFLDLAYARQVNDRLALGASLVMTVQAFEATGLESFAGFTETFAASGGTAFPSSLSGTGRDFSLGFGIKLGLHAELSDSVSLALAYQSKIDMDEFDEYSDLFAGSGDFDIPSQIKAGLTFATSERTAVSVDVEHIRFSEIDAVGNPMANIFTCPTVNPLSTATGGCLGGASGAGFGWDDMTVFKVGAEFNRNSDMVWRAGVSHGSQPIPDTEVLFNVLAPAVIETHVSAGFSKQLAADRSINFSFTYALENAVSGNNPFDPTQTIEIKMNQWEAELSYSWKF